MPSEGAEIMRKVLIISLIFFIASQTFPRTASAQWYTVVENLTPFSTETDFMSVPGFLRYFTYQHYGFYLTYPEAERVDYSRADVVVEALVREIRTLTTTYGTARLSVHVIPISRVVAPEEFGRIYGKILLKALCDPKQKLNTLVKTALSSSASTVLPLIMTSLALPAAALPIVVPIAAYVIVLGVDAFCESSRQHAALSP
jgi:hypothetical protein